MLTTHSQHNSSKNQTQIVVIDDRKLAYEMLKATLANQPDIEIVAYAEDGQQGLEQIATLDPHVAIVDLEMPNMDGTKTIELIRANYPNTHVLVLSGHDEAEYINKAIKAGAKGYLLKGTAGYAIADAIRYVSKGYFHLGSDLLNKLVVANLGQSDSGISPEAWQTQLQEPLKQLKRDLQDGCQSIIDQGLESSYQELTELIELKLFAFGKQQLERVHQIKQLQQQVRFLTITQVCLLFVLVGYAMIGR